ncbi:MAG: hypothetical protein EOP46_11265 [Sphingobacteriaceae bacterium]|nr:MAG: hypothetical protein EOP46_11265 [Sphingobacteriaceae bacterium]
MAGWFVITLFNEVNHIDWLAKQAAENAGPVSFIPLPATQAIQNTDSYQYIIKQYLPYITLVYLIGLLLNVLKLCFAWKNIVQVKHSLTVVNELQHAVNKYANQLKIGKHVSVNISRMVDVPGVIGYLKPIILLPATLSTTLNTAEVEAILLHELAHIKRNDYLLNLLQQVISVVLFFNPFAIIINRIINTERENSCDDEVVKMTSEPLVYAQALLKLEQFKPNNLQLALAATGKKYVLLNRIERIMTTRKLTANVRHILAVIVLFTLSVGSIAWLNPEIKNNKIIINPVALAHNLFADTVPAKKAPKKAPKKTVTAKYKVKTNKGKTTVYTYNNVDDPQLEKLSAEVEKHGDAIQKYYDSPEFKKLSEEMEKKGNAISAYYDSPQMRKLIEEQDRLSEQFDKNWSNNPEMEKLQKELDATGDKIDKYYNAPAYKNLEKQIEAASAKLDKAQYGTAEYKKQLSEVSRLSKEIGAYTRNESIRAQQDQMRQLGQKMREFYQSEGYKAQQTQLRRLGDSLRTLHNNAAIKSQQQALRQLGDKMRAYQNNPQIKLQQKQLAEASARLRAYTNSTEFKARIKAQVREFNDDMDINVEPPATPDLVEPADEVPIAEPATPAVPPTPNVN